MYILMKGEVEFRGIGLEEMIQKVCTSIMNIRLRFAITLNGALHGFVQGWGAGTATLEKKLAQ